MQRRRRYGYPVNRISMTAALAAAITVGLAGCGPEEAVEEDLPAGGAFTSGPPAIEDDGAGPGPIPEDDGGGSGGDDDDDAESGGETCSPDFVPADGLSHAADIQPIWDGQCLFAGACHGADVSTAGLNLETDGLGALNGGMHLNGMPWVTAGDAENSYVWRKIEGTQAVEYNGTGGPMPLAPGVLTPCDTATIEAWILQGAAP